MKESIKKKVRQMLTEKSNEKISILIDGTSSAGKSMTANLLDAVPFYQATDPNQWVVIDSDDFGGKDQQSIKNRIKYDHEGDGKNPQAGEEFHKEMAIERKGGFGEKRGDTTVDFPKHPHNKNKKSQDGRNWYMAQEFIYGGWNKVIFDDISNGILKYVPNAKNILLHAPISVLIQNIDERNKKGKQPRKHEDVLDQYLEKYEATKNTPDGKNIFGHSVSINRKDLEDKLLNSGVSEEYVQYFFTELGMGSDGDYYIKVKDKYLTPGVMLINVDDKRKKYLKQFKSVTNK
jgi:hypothetical protein